MTQAIKKGTLVSNQSLHKKKEIAFSGSIKNLFWAQTIDSTDTINTISQTLTNLWRRIHFFPKIFLRSILRIYRRSMSRQRKGQDFRSTHKVTTWANVNLPNNPFGFSRFWPVESILKLRGRDDVKKKLWNRNLLNNLCLCWTFNFVLQGLIRS